METPEYSIVIPVYNSALTLGELTERLIAVMAGRTLELVFVDDGSSDNSWATILALKQQHPAVAIQAVKLSKNYGQDNATICGFSCCTGKRVITIDDDLQLPPEEITRLITQMDATGADIVYGLFVNKKHSVLRNMASRINSAMAKSFGNKVGIGSAFRLLTIDLAKKVATHNQFFVRVEELVLWYTGKVESVMVNHNERKQGQSGYSTRKLFVLSFNLLFNYSTIPLQLMVVGGFSISLISMVMGTYYIYKKMFLSVSVEGWTSLIVSIMFSTGIIVFSLGLIGQYLLRILTLQNHKPCYSVSEVVR